MGLGHLADDREARAPSRAGRAPTEPGRSGRRRRAGRSRRCRARGRGRRPRRRARSPRRRRRAGSTWRRCRAGCRSARSIEPGTPLTTVSSRSGANVTPPRVAPGALDRLSGDRSRRTSSGSAPSSRAVEGDELGHELAHLGELLDDVGQQALPLLAGSVVGAGEDLDVRAQAGQRRAQLVRGVGDEAALAPRRVLERGEHGVEAGGQAPELVGALVRPCGARGRGSRSPPPSPR